MARCDECKHWKKTEDWEYDSAGFRECTAIKPGWEIMDDAASTSDADYDGQDMSDRGDAWIERRVGALKAARACVLDGSQYVAVLLTGPDFFCALFDPAGG